MLADGVLCISTGQPLQLHHTLLAKKYSDGQNMAIIIDVVRARGLNPKEGQGLLLDRVRDAYCTVKVGEDERKTRTIANSLAPEWSERFEYMASGGTRQCMVSPLVYFARVYEQLELKGTWLGLAWLGSVHVHRSGRFLFRKDFWSVVPASLRYTPLERGWFSHGSPFRAAPHSPFSVTNYAQNLGIQHCQFAIWDNVRRKHLSARVH